ncbi:MAG: M20 family metallopeptidase [Planctomycetota bacterium]
MNAPSESIVRPAPSSDDKALDRLKHLISFNSTSDRCNGSITDYVADELAQLGFQVERSQYFDDQRVIKHNLVARRDPPRAYGVARGIAYFAHTDVVPAGTWRGPGGDPFDAVVNDGRLYGRGACDMKGSLATMLTALDLVPVTKQTAPIWVTCTADEETHLRGAKQLVAAGEAYRDLAQQDPIALIGEPTRLEVVHGHKGIIGVEFQSVGRAAHSSTSDGINANVAMVPMLQTLLEWHDRCEQDESLQDSAFDPPTLNWNFGFHDDAKAVNVVPDRSTAWLTLRPMPTVDGSEILETLRERADELGLEMDTMVGCGPLWTDPDDPVVQDFASVVSPYNADGHPKTVGYATDGAVFDELRHRIICGPGDIAQAHTDAEFIELEQLDLGIRCYRDVLARFACDTNR